MPRPRSPVPSYRKHKSSGQAVCTVRCRDGTRKDILLGRYDSPESKLEFARIVAEIQAGGNPAEVGGGDITVAEVLVQFMRHAAVYYRRPDGGTSTELRDYKSSLKPVRELYAHTPAKEFRPLALQAVRNRMIRDELSRGVINQRVGRIKRVFAWAVANELVPPSVLHGLNAVAGLQRGRSDARETDPVKPANPLHVEAAVKAMMPTLAALVRFQLLTGCRPGEACRLRMADVDVTADVWLYRPRTHKGQWRGHDRVIHIGPRAREVIAPFIPPDPTWAVFSPARSREERYAALRAARKSKVQPSQVSRRKRADQKVKNTPAEFNSPSLCNAIYRACDRAGVPHWHPHQLRHARATEIRKLFGLEAAGATLGHTKMSATEIYAEKDSALARDVAAKIG